MPFPRRDFISKVLNRGLAMTVPRGLMREGQAQKAENVVYTESSAMRRGGKSAAYKVDDSAASTVNFLHRFYDLATTGTVSKYLIMGFGAKLWRADSDWVDATATAITAKTALALPNTTDNTLYFKNSAGYAAGPITMDASTIRSGFASKSWLYVHPEFNSTDDTDITLNVPMRIGEASGDEIRPYLHGLTPPNSIDSADINRTPGGTGKGFWYCLTAEYQDGTLGESGPGTPILSESSGDPNPNVFDLTLPSGGGGDERYDMTREVTRMHLYRTTDVLVQGKSTATTPDFTLTYYRIGSTDCTAGVPDGNITDGVSDALLTANKILDSDRYMPPKYKTGVVWKDRAVIGNLKARDTSDSTVLDYTDSGIHKNRIRFSRGFTPDVFSTNYFMDILPDGDSGEIKRLIVNPLIDHLFVFMEADIMAISGDTVLGERGTPFRPRNIANAKGTPAPYSVVHAEGLIFYWTKSGIEVIDAFKGRNITSDSIAPMWDMPRTNHPRYADRVNTARFDQVRSLYDPKTQRVYWFYPAATSIINNKVLVLDLDRWRSGGMRDGVFTIWGSSTVASLNIDAVVAWDGEGDTGEIFGGNSHTSRYPWTYRLDFSDEDEEINATNDGTDTTAIGAILTLPLHDFGNPSTLKRFMSMDCHGRSGDSDITIRFVADEGDYAADLGTTFNFDNSYRVKRQKSAIARKAIGTRGGFNFTFADQLAGTDGPLPWELYDYSISYRGVPTRLRP